jgi:amino acid permease
MTLPATIETQKSESLGGQCSDSKAVVNIILTAIGVGIIVLPTIMGKCGWIGGSLLLLSTALLTIYSTSLLYYAISENPHGFKESFPSLADSLFGNRMKWLTSINIYGTLILICAVLLVLIGTSITEIAQLPAGYWRLFSICAGGRSSTDMAKVYV